MDIPKCHQCQRNHFDKGLRISGFRAKGSSKQLLYNSFALKSVQESPTASARTIVNAAITNCLILLMILNSCLFLLFVSHHQHTDCICIGACRRIPIIFAVIDDSDSVRAAGFPQDPQIQEELLSSLRASRIFCLTYSDAPISGPRVG